MKQSLLFQTQPSKLLIAGNQPEIRARLQALKIQVAETKADKRLPAPIMYHPDMQVFDFGDGHLFALKKCPTIPVLSAQGFIIHETQVSPEETYPRDILCNALRLNGVLYGNVKALDPGLLDYARKKGFKIQHVRQGYTACATCVVSENAIITADTSIAKAAAANGAAVLLIAPGSIDLPGYNTGFIGGCCVKIDEKTLLSTGAVHCHPDAEKIKLFLNAHKVELLELSKSSLTDIGLIQLRMPET